MVLFNPQNGTCFASFGAHPDFGVALERTVTELLQGRGLKTSMYLMHRPLMTKKWLNTNLETHFIDSSGLMAGIYLKMMPIMPLQIGALKAQLKKNLQRLLVFSIH